MFALGYAGDSRCLKGVIKLYNLNEALKGACAGDRFKLANDLIIRGADNFKEGIAHACEGGHHRMITLMLEKGANITDGLKGAMKRPDLDMARFLLQKGARPNEGLKMLQKVNPANLSFAQLMLDHKADPMIGLKSACESGDLALYHLMFPHIKRQRCLNSCLALACARNHVEIVQLLIQAGADGFDDAMKSATLRRHTEIVHILKEKWKDITMIDDAYYAHDPDFAVSFVENKFYTPNEMLILACEHSGIVLAKLILKLGADITLCTLELSYMDVVELWSHGVSNVGEYQSLLDEHKLRLCAKMDFLPPELVKIVLEY